MKIGEKSKKKRRGYNRGTKWRMERNKRRRGGGYNRGTKNKDWREILGEKEGVII